MDFVARGRTWDKESLASVGKSPRTPCFARSARNTTVSSIRVTAEGRGCALLLAIPKGILLKEK